jgi:hypothetical protein
MPAGIDLGKQYGPLPLGAWVVVVGGALGLAWYTRRSSGVEPEIMEDVSGTPGVGIGAPADWTPIVGTPPPTTTAPTTNEAWAVKAIQWGIAMNYPPNMVDSAVRKYLAGLKLSVQEYTFIGLALIANGPPPQPLPPGEETDPPVIPPVIPPATGGTPARVTGVRVLSPSPRQMTIGWNPVAGATGYQVALVSRAKYFDWVNNTTIYKGYTVKDLSPGLPVVFVVRARNGSKVGPWSLPLATRTPR